jgi:hypothetical protein
MTYLLDRGLSIPLLLIGFGFSDDVPAVPGNQDCSDKVRFIFMKEEIFNKEGMSIFRINHKALPLLTIFNFSMFSYILVTT